MFKQNKLKYILQKINLSDVLIIFDIDGVLLRNNNINYEFSPIITELFDFINKYNIKFAIATHGGNQVVLATKFSPISTYINNLDKNYIKHIGQPQYKFEQFKYNMIYDLITQGIKEFNINAVIFIDDDKYNIKTFTRLQTIFPTLKLKAIHVKLNDTDIKEQQQYPILRYESFNSKINDFHTIFKNLII